MKKVSSGVGLVDELLDGGYESDAITTIYGPAGAGKTNLALAAAVEVARQGKKVIYVDTEGGFSIERLRQILPDHRKVLERIVFLRPTKFAEQNQTINKLKELVSNRIGLIVVDTMTMLYRLERSFKEEDYNRELGMQMLALNEIARKHNIPVLLTSQVYSSFDQQGKVKMVGGDILLYASKCLLELEPGHGKRRLVLKKHRSLQSGKEAFFRIAEKGLERA